MKRRGFLKGMAALVAAPAVVRAGEPEAKPLLKFGDTLRQEQDLKIQGYEKFTITTITACSPAYVRLSCPAGSWTKAYEGAKP